MVGSSSRSRRLATAGWVGTSRAASTRRSDSPIRSALDRLAYVVGNAKVERLGGTVVVRGHEYDRRWPGEPAEHPGHLHPVQARHPDVEEYRVHVVVPQHAQRVGHVAGRVHHGHAGVGAEQVGELVQGGRLVVDG